MKLSDYQREARRTLTMPADPSPLLLAVIGLGLAGEAGEVVELIKKHVGHGHDLDAREVKKELGDVLWYLAGVASLLGLNLDDIAHANIEKLKARYPEGFKHEPSRNRTEGV